MLAVPAPQGPGLWPPRAWHVVAAAKTTARGVSEGITHGIKANLTKNPDGATC
jgi:hypothetical protein